MYHVGAGNHDRPLRRCFFKDLLTCANPDQHPREQHVVHEIRAPRFSLRAALRPRRLCGFRARFSQVSREACERVLDRRQARMVAGKLPSPPRLREHRKGTERPKPESRLWADKPLPLYGILFFKSHWRARTWTRIHLSDARASRPVSRDFLCEFLCGLCVSVVFGETFSQTSGG